MVHQLRYSSNYFSHDNFHMTDGKKHPDDFMGDKLKYVLHGFERIAKINILFINFVESARKSISSKLNTRLSKLTSSYRMAFDNLMQFNALN